MQHYHIWTIGCQMNKAESERLAAVFEQRGMKSVARAEDADLVIVNTCVVRGHAEEKVVNKLAALKALKLANPNAKLAVTGCWVDSQPDKLRHDYPHIDHFFKAGDCPPWEAEDEWRHALPSQPAITSYVTIIQGCNNFCTYCIVPYRRGREKSRPVSEVVCEVRERVRRGTREVTLLGQNVDSYGHNLPGKPDLADLLTELNGIEGLWRIRFLTNHPKDMSLRLIETMARLDKVCESINVPVQAGSDAILKLMRRGYTVEDYRRLIARIRDYIPGVALSNDVIVGFPTETQAQFGETIALLTDLRFDIVHVAAYSPRPGTTAARDLPDDVPAAEKKRRLQAIEQLQEKIAGEINAALLGDTVEVLVEGRQKGKWYGRTPTDKLVFFPGEAAAQLYGKLATIRIEHAGPWSLQGTISK